MKILHNSFAVFWSHKEKPVMQQFHADMFKLHPEETAVDVVARHERMFPDDRIHSVRDTSGRFLPFRPSKRHAAAMVAELNRFRHG